MFPITITIKNAVQLQAVMAILDPEQNEYAKAKAIQAEPTPEPVKVEKAPKAAAAVQSAPPPEQSAPAASTAESPSEAAAVAFDDVKAAIIGLAKTKGREAAVAVLSAFGATKVPDLKAEQYAAVLEAAQKAVA